MPSGTWVDFHSGERHSGGKYITAAAPLDHIPLFQRGGFVIPMYDHAPVSTMDHHPELLELHLVVPDEDGVTRSMLQEDDGLSNAFQAGAFLRTAFEVTRRSGRIVLRAETTGKGFPEFRRTRFRLILKGFSGDTLELDGRAVSVRAGVLEYENSGRSFELAFAV